MPKYFLFTGPYNHLSSFKKHNYAQQYHNHKSRLDKLSKGDYVVFYASRANENSTVPYRKFIAIGRVTNDKTFRAKKGKNIYFRKKVKFLPFKEKSLKDVINKLKFIKNKKYYGLYFISGFRELSKGDFDVIARE